MYRATITAVRAARWNTDAEIGGVWRIKVVRMAAGVALPLAAPCTLDLWAIGVDAATATPAKNVTGVLAGDNKSVTFSLTVNEVSLLGLGPHEHRLKLTDPTLGTLVITRGWMTVRGRADDL